MASPNGTATAVQDDPLDLGDLVSEMKVVTIRRDGKPVRLEAFVYATAPVSVYALIAQAHDELMAVLNDPAVYGIHREQAQNRFDSQVARALTTGMTIDEADRLGGDPVRLSRYLAALGYPPPRSDAAVGEAAAAGSITETSSRVSGSATAAPTPTG